MINIEIKDHNSKIIGLIPEQLHEPIALIAKVKGFDSIDDYVIDVVKRELESLREGGHAADDFGESVAYYLQNMISPLLFPHDHSSSGDDDDDDDKSIEKKKEDSSVDEDNDEDEDEDEKGLYEEIPVTLKLNKNIAEVARIFARYYHYGDDRIGYFDKFISEQVIKIVPALAESAPIQEKFPDSLKQHIQKLLSSSSVAVRKNTPVQVGKKSQQQEEEDQEDQQKNNNLHRGKNADSKKEVDRLDKVDTLDTPSH